MHVNSILSDRLQLPRDKGFGRDLDHLDATDMVDL